jgi:hypothetical protein
MRREKRRLSELQPGDRFKYTLGSPNTYTPVDLGGVAVVRARGFIPLVNVNHPHELFHDSKNSWVIVEAPERRKGHRRGRREGDT